MFNMNTLNASDTIRCPESLENVQVHSVFFSMAGFPYRFLPPLLIEKRVDHSDYCTRKNKLNCPLVDRNLFDGGPYIELT